MNDWKYIDEYESLPDAEVIHCDTRDFCIMCTDSTPDYLESIRKGIRKSAGYGPLDECKFPKSKILKVLKKLEERSGGKGEWRMLSTESHPSWLKYVRFLKTSKVVDGEPWYVAYSTMGDDVEVLSHKILGEPINQEYLSHH